MLTDIIAYEWSESFKPNTKSPYDHCYLETPIGKALLEWKSWKQYDSITFTLGDTYICEYHDDLDDAKTQVINYLRTIANTLLEYTNRI